MWSVYDKDHMRYITSFSSYNEYKLNSHLTCFQWGFIAQSVEHRTGIAEVMGSNPIGASEFFLGFICNCLSYFCFTQESSSGSQGIGLTSQEAYKRLFDAVQEELAAFSAANSVHWTTDVLNTLRCGRRSPMGWISLTFLFLEVLLMIITYGLSASGRYVSKWRQF